MPGELFEGGFVEDLRDQAHVLEDKNAMSVAGRDAGRLLAAMLQRVQAVVGEFRDFLAGSPDSEHSAGVLRALLAGQQLVTELAITALHGPSLVGVIPGLEGEQATQIRALPRCTNRACTHEVGPVEGAVREPQQTCRIHLDNGRRRPTPMRWPFNDLHRRIRRNPQLHCAAGRNPTKFGEHGLHRRTFFVALHRA